MWGDGVLEPSSDWRNELDELGHQANSCLEKWFVVQTKRAKEVYAREHLRRQHFKTFLPRISVSSRRYGKTITNHVPLFPGYLFVTFDLDCPGWCSINGTRGVSRLLRSECGRPLALPQDFIMSLIGSCDASEIIRRCHFNLTVGEPIEVIVGPFAKQLGQLVSLDTRGRAQVLLSLMGTSVCVNLTATSLKSAHV